MRCHWYGIACGAAIAALAVAMGSTEPITARSGGTAAAQQPGGLARATVQPRTMPQFPWAVELAIERPTTDREIQLCQACNPVICGVGETCAPGPEPHWSASQPIPWQVFAQGEYIGHARTAHVDEYRLRVGDVLDIVYRFTAIANDEAYRFDVGDELIIESLTDRDLNRGDLTQGRGLKVQPDGTINLPLLGQVSVRGRTVAELQRELDEKYTKFYKLPTITITPLRTNAQLESLREAVLGRFSTGGQMRQATVTPEGTIQLPGIPSTFAVGLTLTELEHEVEARYVEEIDPGIDCTVVLLTPAPRYAYVLGEVVQPGQIQLSSPTTVIQAISRAGGWRIGGNLRQVVVFRRTDDWRLMATKLDLSGALYGKRPIPSDEIWLRDSDIVIVPKSPIQLVDDFVNLVFTNGIYGAVPINGVWTSVAGVSTI